ncbi:hypothetical protein ACOKW7_23375 [Limnospira platensis CENA597]|uniref:hypothetical protein n=1 Tax=Limnospira platensis TaxID=118562 RepID=UPI003D6F1144
MKNSFFYSTVKDNIHNRNPVYLEAIATNSTTKALEHLPETSIGAIAFSLKC